MKVILLQDVAKIGRRYSIVEVNDGYALNQLMPKKLAEPATPANVARVEKMRSSTAASADAAKKQYETSVAALAGSSVVIETDVNEQGHLFKAVSAEDIAAAAKAADIAIDARQVLLKKPIKEAGEHTLMLVHAGASNPFTVTIVNRK